MNNVYLERDYKGYATVLIPDVVIGEFELSLDRETNSPMGYLLVEPGTIKEETIFYHRSSGNTVWFYQVNRTGTFEHADNSQVLLVNSIDYMNYILGQTNEQLFLYKTSNTDLVIKGGKFYIASQMITLSDLDTSLDEEGKTLFNDSVNYIYIDTENLDFLITNSVNNNYYLVATVLTNAGGVIQSINKEKTLHIGTIGMTGPQGEQGPQGTQGNQGNPGVDGAEVEIRNNGTYIQWKYDNETDSSRRNIISISAITGADGSDGKEVEMQKGSTHIERRLSGTSTWLQLIAISDLVGETGNPGINGTNGINGKSAYELAVENGFEGTEEEWLESLKGKDGNIGTPTATGQYIEDAVVVNTDLYTVTNNNSTYIKITENNTGYNVLYNLSGVAWRDENNSIYNVELSNGTWGDVGELQGINYENGMTIDTLGTVRYTAQPAYRDRENIFTKTNIFKGFTDFQGDVGFKWYNQNTVNVVNFDASLGKKHIFSINNGGTKIMDFSNLKPGTNYEFFINVSGSSTILSFNGTTLTNCGSIDKVYCIGGGITASPTFGISLDVGTHHFVATLGTEAIHLVYTGTSVEISNAVNIV